MMIGKVIERLEQAKVDLYEERKKNERLVKQLAELHALRASSTAPNAGNRLPPRETDMTMEDQMMDLVARQFGIGNEGITPETRFVEDLGADSLDTLELVMEFGDEFEISIPDEDFIKGQIETVGQAIELVQDKIAAR